MHIWFIPVDLPILQLKILPYTKLLYNLAAYFTKVCREVWYDEHPYTESLLFLPAWIGQTLVEKGD